ncbi:MAG: noncanonical pyrimidine nucleotidase, YjjG family [Chloroflexi bacterium]|nr:noncanonical pyrimidine nucleotidase, YjjG family [Chloroflexota bacterium]
MSYTWLLFDADGTLFDFDWAEANALAQTFADFNLPYAANAADVYHKINAQIWRDFERGRITSAKLRTERFARLFTAINVQADTSAFAAQYLHHLANGTRLIDGAEELMGRLNGRYRLALITNGLKDVQRPRLAQSVLADAFDAVIISDEEGVAKPDPALFDIAFARMGQPAKADVLIIGDSLTSDMQGGVNYGIDTCWFNPAGRALKGQLKVRYEISHLSELLSILE